MRKTVGISVVLVCFLFLSLGTAQAGVRDQFERFSGFGGLSSAFERLATFNKVDTPGQPDGFTPAFHRLSTLNGQMSDSSLKPSFRKLGSLDPTMGRVGLKPSFERLATTAPDLKNALKTNLERMAKVSMRITGELKPSFSKLGNLSPAMQGNLTPAFSRLATVSSAMTGELKPSFTRLGRFDPTLTGELRASFAKLGTVSPALSGQINPSFARLGNLASETTTYLKPSFMKLASISPAFSGALSPSFAKLASMNPALSQSLNPAFSRLATFSQKFMPQQQTFNMRKEPSLRAVELASNPLTFHSVPTYTGFKGATVRNPRRSVALEQYFGGPGSLYRLSLKPGELKNVSSEEAAKILQSDIHLIQPQALDLGVSAVGYEATPQHISLISLLGVEKTQ